MERLNNLKQLLSDAVADKENNRDYIEDLLLTIEYQQIIVDKMVLHRIIK